MEQKIQETTKVRTLDRDRDGVAAFRALLNINEAESTHLKLDQSRTRKVLKLKWVKFLTNK